MLTKKLFALSGLVIAACAADGQSLSPQVISSGGGYYSAGSSSLSSTTGEMTMVATFSSGSVVVTQGFQQPEDLGVGLTELPDAGGVSFGPNPTTGRVNLFFKSTDAEEMLISVFDLKGSLITSIKTEKNESSNFITFDLSMLPAGDYLLDCRSNHKADGKATHYSTKFTIIN